VNSLAVEVLAEDVAKAYGLELPVNLEQVAKEESIELAPGDYPANFHGRLEFHPREGIFILFHPEPRPGLSLGRIRFSIAHELGHYFLEEHRGLIVSGAVHNSVESFKPAQSRIEREADQFASALLIPECAFRKYLGSRHELPLTAIIELSHLAKTSIQATLFRYAHLAEEACVMVVAKAGKVLRSFSSGLAKERGFGWLGAESVPPGCTALNSLRAEPFAILEGQSDTSRWFSERHWGGQLWEESTRVGAGDYTVTILSWPEK